MGYHNTDELDHGFLKRQAERVGREMRARRFADMLVAEYLRATEKHKELFASAHEGRSIIDEEVWELTEHVYHDTAYSAEAAKEAIQVGAMAMKFLFLIETRTGRTL